MVCIASCITTSVSRVDADVRADVDGGAGDASRVLTGRDDADDDVDDERVA